MADNPYDKTCRQMARRYRLDVLLWLLGLSAEQVQWVRWLDTRGIPSPWERDRTSDTVAFLRDLAAGGLPWAVPLEFCLDPDPLMFGRLLVYMGNIWLAEKPDPECGDRFCVSAIVVNLRGRGNSSRRYEWREANLLTHMKVKEVDLEGEKASVLMDQVEAKKAAAILLSVVPVMNGGDDPGIVDRWVRRVTTRLIPV